MTLFKLFFNIIIFTWLAVACTKNNSAGPLVALNVINANSGLPAILIYLTDAPGNFSKNKAPVGYGGFNEYGTPAGANPISIFNRADTIKPLFQSSLDLAAGKVYSLYLAGNAPQVDTLFREDIIPFHADSVASIRVVNLSPDSQPLTINLEGNPSSYEFSDLIYKSVSDFKTYPSTGDISNYNFEIRDQETGNLLTTFQWYNTVFKSNTFVISGSTDPSSSTPLNIFQVNHF